MSKPHPSHRHWESINAFSSVDISKIGLKDLRSKVSIIPQDVRALIGHVSIPLSEIDNIAIAFQRDDPF